MESNKYVKIGLTENEVSKIIKENTWGWNMTGRPLTSKNQHRIWFLDKKIYIRRAVYDSSGKAMFNSTWRGNTFAEQWVESKKVITKDASVKPIRAFHKTLILAMQYGQGPAGMVIKAADEGLKLKLGDAKQFHNAFWNDLLLLYWNQYVIWCFGNSFWNDLLLLLWK